MSTDSNNCLSCASFSKSALVCLDRLTINGSIVPNSVPMSYKKGQEVFKEGSPVKGVFCIQEGKIKIYKGCDARNLTIGLAGNSDTLGYTSLFNGGTYLNSARCIEDSDLCFIPKKVFLNLITNNNELLIELLKRSSLENYRMSNLLRDLKCKNMLSRVSGALLEIANKFGLDNNKFLNLTLSRKEIGDISGTTTESVIRILNQLKKEGIIDLVGRKIKIKDHLKLQRQRDPGSHK